MSPQPKSDYPSKLYYSISEVARIAGVKAHVLRYWESEFSTLRPKKTRNGSRRYRKADIEEILAIKSLLYDEGFKIAGARKVRLETRRKAKDQETTAATQLDLGFGAADQGVRMEMVKRELREILELVRQLGAQSGAAPATKGAEKPSQATLRALKGKG
ncbi:MerR family transcriptional regulator [bacterium DOLJORAL78_65_58]|nr:MAG: MerR family transcriptional regulator [bacterium DOLZORAL124_64_63]PIE76585.1 MAG: MerR family transcriptional regulator [bacterium DOLJORAL78_65_58]